MAENADVVSFMAASHNPIESRSVVDMPTAVRQADEFAMEDEFAIENTTDEESESEDGAWQLMLLFSIHGPPVEQYVSPALQAQQCATALGWPRDSLEANYEVTVLPSDLVDQRKFARLCRHSHDLPPGSNQQMVLIDIEFHPAAPRFDVHRVRNVLYLPPVMTTRQFLRALQLEPYCEKSQLPCLVWCNSILWGTADPEARHLANGNFLRVAVPAPTPIDELEHVFSHCLAVALWHGFASENALFYQYLRDEFELDEVSSQLRVIHQSQIASPSQEHDEEIG